RGGRALRRADRGGRGVGTGPGAAAGGAVSLAQLLLDGSLGESLLLAKVCHRLQGLVAARHDPLVRYRLCGRDLVLPLSHDLPWNRRVFPGYSDNLRRLAALVRARRGTLRLI